METIEPCPDCGAPWQNERRCQDDFYQMLYWEAEFPAFWEVHHLMVLCYHLQHPSLYSPEGLNHAKGLLIDFVERGVTTQEVRRNNRDMVDSGKRAWKITARADSKGSYEHPVRWEKTAATVVAAGTESYCENVRAWARSVYETLQASGNLPAR